MVHRLELGRSSTCPARLLIVIGTGWWNPGPRELRGCLGRLVYIGNFERMNAYGVIPESSWTVMLSPLWNSSWLTLPIGSGTILYIEVRQNRISWVTIIFAKLYSRKMVARLGIIWMNIRSYIPVVQVTWSIGLARYTKWVSVHLNSTVLEPSTRPRTAEMEI